LDSETLAIWERLLQPGRTQTGSAGFVGTGKEGEIQAGVPFSDCLGVPFQKWTGSLNQEFFQGGSFGIVTPPEIYEYARFDKTLNKGFLNRPNTVKLPFGRIEENAIELAPGRHTEYASAFQRSHQSVSPGPRSTLATLPTLTASRDSTSPRSLGSQNDEFPLGNLSNLASRWKESDKSVANLWKVLLLHGNGTRAAGEKFGD
jgi:hypothetical protein